MSISASRPASVTPRRAFALALRRARLRRRLSQERLALDSGLSRNYVSLLERGEHSVSLDVLFILSRALRVSPSGLVRRVERDASRLPERAESLR